MGILDTITGMLGGGDAEAGANPTANQAQGAMSIVNSLLQQGGQTGQSSNIVGALLGAVGGQATGAAGGQNGVAAMLETMAANGLADHVSSWLSNNPNLPVTPQQIHDALGSEQVQQMAASAGLPVADFLQHLAQHLPQAAAEQAGAAQG